MQREQLKRAAVFCGLVAVAITVRLVSETPNFNAVVAASLFAGFYFRQRLTAVCVPLVAMTVSDLIIGGYERHIMVAVYASLLLPIAWRSVLRSRLTPARVALGALSSSLAFYLLTNAAVWYTWYPHTAAALTRCYVVAIPFLTNALASDMMFATGFFGLYCFARLRHAARDLTVAGATA